MVGGPGAGKGTQAAALAKRLGLAHVASGDLFRRHLRQGTELGRQAAKYMERGSLVPDDLTITMIEQRLGEADAAEGVILDGFPRTVAQAEALDALLHRRGQGLDRVIFFDVSRDELLRRLTGRRICRRCGHAFHLVSAPPKVAGVCDHCGGELYQREDDAEGTVGRRLDVYQTQTAPLLDYYKRRGLLVRVDGEGPMAQVADSVKKAVREPVAS